MDEFLFDPADPLGAPFFSTTMLSDHTPDQPHPYFSSQPTLGVVDESRVHKYNKLVPEQYADPEDTMCPPTDWIPPFKPECNSYDEGNTTTTVPPQEPEWLHRIPEENRDFYLRMDQLHSVYPRHQTLPAPPPPQNSPLPPQHYLALHLYPPPRPLPQWLLSAEQQPPPQHFLAPPEQPPLFAQQPPPPFYPPPQQPQALPAPSPPLPTEEAPRRGRGRPPGSKDKQPRKTKKQAKRAAEAGSIITAPVKSSEHRVEKKRLDRRAQLGAGTLLTPSLSPPPAGAGVDGQGQVGDGSAVSEGPILVEISTDAQGRIKKRYL